MARRVGVLLHPSSLPGDFGRGDFGPAADRFLEWLSRAGASVWQILPLGPCGYGESPYGCSSAFAGNRYLISPERLLQSGWIADSAIAAAGGGFSSDAAAARWRDAVLRQAWTGFRDRAAPPDRSEFESFRNAPEQARWLPDWALFAALKLANSGAPWSRWPPELAGREPSALAAARRDLRSEIEFEEFVQFAFARQWSGVRRNAGEWGIRILGDLPIYVSHDSADVWSNQELFDLDADREPASVSGVPPDYFSSTGQRWGSPLYRWDRMEKRSFAWWIDRLRANLRLADEVRIDHFRGFAAYWSIPASEPTAIRGEWLPAPGRKLFEAARAALGSLPFVAEDLGVITPDVAELRDSLGLPGMRVLQFGFSRDDSPHLPHRHVPNCVVYTGTHDNDTARGWFAHAGEEERRRACDYFGSDGREIEWDMIRAALESVAETAVAPLQDLLGLGSEARFNTPGRAEGNWSWQAAADAFREDVAARLRRLAELTGRAR